VSSVIGPGDLLEISEYHTSEFRSAVKVSTTGAVTLPMVGDVGVARLDEHAAAQAIEAALVAKGMLLHPLVTVMVTASAGQDVSVLGEVTRPGVYPYAAHHLLLDLISAASGFAPTSGRLVNIFSRTDPETPHAVVLDPTGTDKTSNHNPELSPGDTVQVSRAGLVYVVGDVIRPGGFPVDPVRGLTVVPYFSRMIAYRDWAGCRHTLRTWAWLTALVSAPVAALLIAGAHIVIRITLQHGAFGPNDTAVVTRVLAMYALQIPFYVGSRVFFRFIVAMRRTDLVFYCGVINLALDVVLNLVLIRWFGVAGIALATSLWTASTFFFFWFWSRRLLARASSSPGPHVCANP
jgi:protein involved in polysaccharide export with SLBB domain